LYFGRMPAAALRRRASRPAAFDGRVLAPEPYDAACLAVAHFVKDCVGQQGHGGLAMDLGSLETLAGVTPSRLAERLREHALRRVGIVAFSALVETDSRSARWLDPLQPSTTELTAARSVCRAMQQHGKTHPDLAYLLARSVADDPVTGACGFAATAARLLRDRVKRAAGHVVAAT
jgi:hypothetical protein